MKIVLIFDEGTLFLRYIYPLRMWGGTPKFKMSIKYCNLEMGTGVGAVLKFSRRILKYDIHFLEYMLIFKASARNMFSVPFHANNDTNMVVPYYFYK